MAWKFLTLVLIFPRQIEAGAFPLRIFVKADSMRTTVNGLHPG
jgi:hypothetical protein